MTDGSKAPRRAKPSTDQGNAKRSAASKAAGLSNRTAETKKRAEDSLDDALDDTFPASDPVSAKQIT